MRGVLPVLALAVPLAACDDMSRQPRYDPFEASALFDNGRVAQDPVPGTIAFDEAAEGPEPPPPTPTPAALERGRAVFDAQCAPCHGPLARGDGMAVGRYVPQPPDLHGEARRALPPQAIVTIITHGVGRMPSYAHHLPPADRWAVAWYVKALQISQRAAVDALPPPVPHEPPPDPSALPGRMTDLRRARLAQVAEAAAVLHTAAWIDKDAGIARIPIAAAMERFLADAAAGDRTRRSGP